MPVRQAGGSVYHKDRVDIFSEHAFVMSGNSTEMAYMLFLIHGHRLTATNQHAKGNDNTKQIYSCSFYHQAYLARNNGFILIAIEFSRFLIMYSLIRKPLTTNPAGNSHARHPGNIMPNRGINSKTDKHCRPQERLCQRKKAG